MHTLHHFLVCGVACQITVPGHFNPSEGHHNTFHCEPAALEACRTKQDFSLSWSKQPEYVGRYRGSCWAHGGTTAVAGENLHRFEMSKVSLLTEMINVVTEAPSQFFWNIQE